MKRWNQKNIWKSLGFTQFTENLFNNNFKKELCKSFLIILFWSLLLIIGKFIRLKSGIHYTLLFDILFTSIFVGLAEELLFRVWLFEELKLFLSTNKAIILQSFFSQWCTLIILMKV